MDFSISIKFNRTRRSKLQQLQMPPLLPPIPGLSRCTRPPFFLPLFILILTAVIRPSLQLVPFLLESNFLTLVDRDRRLRDFRWPILRLKIWSWKRLKTNKKKKRTKNNKNYQNINQPSNSGQNSVQNNSNQIISFYCILLIIFSDRSIFYEKILQRHEIFRIFYLPQ